MELIKAKPNDFTVVRDFYYQLIDEMQGVDYAPKWAKGVYPSDEFISDAIKNQELYMTIQNDVIAGVMIINHECNDGYSKVNWKVNAEKDEVNIIHALGVLPVFQGQGIAQAMVQKAIELSSSQKAIRLDVLGSNIPAQKLYTKMGFEYRDTISMFYEDTGWTDFLLYEYEI